MTTIVPLVAPLLPLRDAVVFPGTVLPLFVGRERSIAAVNQAVETSKQIVLAAQKDSNEENPEENEIADVGTLATILQLLKLPDGTVKVLVEGLQRVQITAYEPIHTHFSVQYKVMEPKPLDNDRAELLTRTVTAQFEKYVKLNKKIPAELLSSLANIQDPGRLSDTITAHMTLKIAEKQKLLEISEIQPRLEHLISVLETELDLLQMQSRLQSTVKKNVERTHREFYLNEQMRAIQEELGQGGANEIEELKEKIEKASMPKEAKEKAIAELNKYKMMSPMSAEATVCRNYLEWLIQVPWNKATKMKINLPEAKRILDKDHYGLEEVKKRIVEYLAVQKRVGKIKGPILCLVGAPGVGKTSLAQSIATACGRKFTRVALGGVRDEAEIRGHRRTYIGAMPGKIIQKLAKVDVKNPLFLLDEIDKMAMDFRGDPASALLEVLDPEQNNTFNDHYLEVDCDLSDVMFVATANTLNIPPALLDRMEIIRLSGYTEDEKLNIAKQHLIAKQKAIHGLLDTELEVKDEVFLDIIRYYTREAGVRSLEREIAKVCRKVLTERTSKSAKEQKTLGKTIVSSKNLVHYLGIQRYRFGLADEKNNIGKVAGLAWTEVGGETLTIEAAVLEGKAKIVATGQLGKVMEESIQAALTVVRTRAASLGIPSDIFEKRDVHVHLPEGGIPKDGPSAGIGICTALVSAFTRIPVRADFAMTGEITLLGDVLPIGGLKEKLLAARRAGIKHVIIPADNERELSEVPENIVADLTIHRVRWIDEVLNLALAAPPKPLVVEAQEIVEAVAASKKVKSSKGTSKSGGKQH